MGKVSLVKDEIKELTLLLIYLSSWEEDGYVYEKDEIIPTKTKVCWKGYSFDILNELVDENYLYDSKHSNKSVTLTKEGEEYARSLLDKYLVK